MTEDKIKKMVFDTSVIISGLWKKALKDKLVDKDELTVIVPNVVIAEIEHMANLRRSVGYIGLRELEAIRRYYDRGFIKELIIKGERPTLEQIKLSKAGEIDNIIREVALKEGATLVTGDIVQATIARIMGIRTMILREKRGKKVKLEELFDEHTMSVHIKEDVPPMAKRGTPGNWKLVKIYEEPLKKSVIERLAMDILEKAKTEERYFIELDEPGATVIQMGQYRIAICRPPFSERLEITIVRPILKVSLTDYNLSDKLIDRLKNRAEGILVAGPPGAGKCLPEGTPVYKSDGEILRIEEVFEDESVDEVLGLDEEGRIVPVKIVGRYSRVSQSFISIKTISGRKICITEEHPVLVFRDGVNWVPGKELNEFDLIAVPLLDGKLNSRKNVLKDPEWEVAWEPIISVERTIEERKVYDLETETHNFIAGFGGIVIHNSTFAQAVAEFYQEMGKIVKTIEKPRDLQVKPEITQYTALSGDIRKTAEVLLLVRPDYTIFDEMRHEKDFEIFTDLRFGGVGMVGVIHSSSAVDAINRFIGKVELGQLSQVVDTVIFIKDGKIAKVYSLDIAVRVPTGMASEDLARPIVEVKDFETGEVEYEIYTFGEQVVVAPVRELGARRGGAFRLAEIYLRNELKKKFPKMRIGVKVVSEDRAILEASEKDAPHIIGRGGKIIDKLEEKYGIHLVVETRKKSRETKKTSLEEEGEALKGKVKVDVRMTKHQITLKPLEEVDSNEVIVGTKDRDLFLAELSKGKVKVKRKSREGKLLEDLISMGEELYISPL
ncbi:MAG: hypothetical protein J7L50_02985 [Candidatus Odinarchaeota archaeon]|nr:hypothetical protein [Candidatus Odinarchaeota archaeon]